MFYDIKAECDGTDCTNDIEWAARVKDANCDMQANILNSTTISITWDTMPIASFLTFCTSNGR